MGRFRDDELIGDVGTPDVGDMGHLVHLGRVLVPLHGFGGRRLALRPPPQPALPRLSHATGRTLTPPNSCIAVEEPRLVARAVLKLWRRAYETESLADLDTAENPP